MKLVSIVVPCYNEEKVLPLFYAEITKVMSQMQEKYPELDFELLFINDGSKDGTLQEFRKMAKMDHRVRYVSFSRNFGNSIRRHSYRRCMNMSKMENMTVRPHGVSAERVNRKFVPGSPENSIRL